LPAPRRNQQLTERDISLLLENESSRIPCISVARTNFRCAMSQQNVSNKPVAWSDVAKRSKAKVPVSGHKKAKEEAVAKLRKHSMSFSLDASEEPHQWPSLDQQNRGKTSRVGKTPRPKSVAETLAERLRKAAEAKTKPRLLTQPVNLTSNSAKEEPVKADNQHEKSPSPDEPMAPTAELAKEFSAEERERICQLRRERRHKNKEKKRKEKEQKKRELLYLPKSSKIKIVSWQTLQQQAAGKAAAPEVVPPPAPAVKLRFMDEEYPELNGQKDKEGGKCAKVLSRVAVDSVGRLLSDAESGSEWETDDESLGKSVATVPDEEASASTIELIVNSGTITYSSILKSQRSAKVKAKEALQREPSPVLAELAAMELPEVAKVKKVKKKDPIVFDLSSIMQVKSL